MKKRRYSTTSFQKELAITLSEWKINVVYEVLTTDNELFKIFRNCFEFLQKVFLDLMYSFSCVLWAILGHFCFYSSSDSPLSSSLQK